MGVSLSRPVTGGMFALRNKQYCLLYSKEETPASYFEGFAFCFVTVYLLSVGLVVASPARQKRFVTQMQPVAL